MKLKLTVLVTLLFVGTLSQAQNIQGKVIDQKGKPIQGATVSLHKLPDSSLVTGIFTDSLGRYQCSINSLKKYYVEARMIGYLRVKSKAFTITSLHENQTIPDMTLQESAKLLKEVSAVSQRPFIERQADKTIVNVESSLVSTGSTALEILRRTPGITLDKDDHLLLKGKSGVSVMLDGKLTYLSPDQIANLLKNMASENIAKIEVITNPSAKYDAAGNSGIVNIITKKGKKIGLNGNITGTLSKGLSYGYNSGLNINYKTAIFNLFGDFNFSNNQNIFRRFNYSLFSKNPLSANEINNTNYNHNRIFNYKGGMDINVSKKTSVGFTLNGYNGHFDQKGDGISNVLNRNSGKVDTTYKNQNFLEDFYSNVTLAGNLKTKLDTLGQELSIDADYAKFKDPSFSNQVNAPFTGSPLTPSGTSITLINHQPSFITINTAKVDYTLPFDSTKKLEMGIKTSWVKSENDFTYDSLSNGIQARPTRENNFIYTERILATYISGSLKFKKLTLGAGLRLEKTTSSGNLVSSSILNARNYIDFFPNLSIQQKFNAKHSLGLSITRRIDRPDYANINPFIYYIDKNSFFQGNPNLLSQYTYQAELSYTFLEKYIASVSWSRTINDIEEFATFNTLKQQTKYTVLNFNVLNNFSASFNAPIDFTDWWTSTNSFSTNYFKRNIQLIVNGNNPWFLDYNANIIETFKLPKDLKIEINSFYNSPGFDGVYHFDPQYAIGLGIQKTLLKKRMDLKANVNDLFNTNHFYGYSSYNNVNITIRNSWESRRFSFSFTYRFGGTNANNNEKKKSNEEESKRAGGKG